MNQTMLFFLGCAVVGLVLVALSAFSEKEQISLVQSAGETCSYVVVSPGSGGTLGGFLIIILLIASILGGLFVSRLYTLGGNLLGDGDTRIAQITGTRITNIKNSEVVSLTLFNPRTGAQLSKDTYSLNGDDWTLEADVIGYQPWLNFLGLNNGFRFTRLTSQFEDFKAHEIQPVKLGERLFQQGWQKTWVSSFIRYEGESGVSEPADGVTYNVFLSLPKGDFYAVPMKK